MKSCAWGRNDDRQNAAPRTPYWQRSFGVLILPIHPVFAETVEAKLPLQFIAPADFRGRPAIAFRHPAAYTAFSRLAKCRR